MASRELAPPEDGTSCNPQNPPTEVTGQQQPPAQDKFTFLKELTASRRHLHKTFYEHLFNVYRYLQEQGFPPAVCDAGLFHSVYGTESYGFHSARITRDVVRGYIGSYGEELVYLFCSMKNDRFGTILENRLGVSRQQHLDLCRLEHANFWDQRHMRGVEARMKVLEARIAKLQGEEIGGQADCNSEGEVVEGWRLFGEAS